MMARNCPAQANSKEAASAEACCGHVPLAGGAAGTWGVLGAPQNITSKCCPAASRATAAMATARPSPALPCCPGPDGQPPRASGSALLGPCRPQEDTRCCALQAARQQQPNNKTKRSQRPGEPGFLSKNTTQRIFLCFLPAKARRAEEVIRSDGNKHVDFKQQSKCKLRVSNHHLPSAPDFRKTKEITRCAWRIKATIKRAEFCLPVYQLFACVGVAAERRGSASRAPLRAGRFGGRAAELQVSVPPHLTALCLLG